MSIQDVELSFGSGVRHAVDERTLNKRANTPAEPSIEPFLDGYGQQSAFPDKEPSYTGYPKAPQPLARNGHWKWPNFGRANHRKSLGRPSVPLGTGLATFAFLGIAVPAMAFAFPSVTEFAARAVFSAIPNSVYSDVEATTSCAMTTQVVDATGVAQGLLGLSGCERTTYLTAAVSDEGAKRLADALIAVEGEVSGPGTILNINLKGLARAVQYFGQAGGTNFLQSSIEAAIGRQQSLDLPEKLWLLLVVGTAYTADHLTTDDAKLKFAVENLQCIAGAPGSAFGPALAGDLCAAMVGRSTLAEVTEGEACILAASLRDPLKVPAASQGDAVIRTYGLEFAQLKERARNKCAPKMPGVLSEILAQIDEVRLPQPGSLKSVAQGTAENLPFAVRLLGEFGVDHTGATLQTTLIADVQRPLVARALQLGDDLAPVLDPHLCWSALCGNNRADIAVAVFEVTGSEIRTLGGYESRGGLLGGPKDGLPHRSVGSLTKILIAPLLIETGVTRLCRSSWGDLHDSDGYGGAACVASDDYLTIEQALARSSNLAIADGLRQVDPDRLRSYLLDLGYTLHGDLTNAELIRSAITGQQVAISPLNIIRNYAGMMFAPDGITPPNIIGADQDDTVAIAFSDLIAEEALQTAGRMASAPLKVGGTVHSAQQALLAAGCTDIFGKSGTSDSVVTHAYRDKLVVLGGRCRGRQLVAIALVGSPDIGIPVGNVTTPQVATLATQAIQLVIQKGN